MKKNVIVLLLCISSNSVGMEQALLPCLDNVPKIVRRRRIETLPSLQILPALVSCLEDNKIDALRNELKYIMEKCPHLLRYKCSAKVLHEAIIKNRYECAELLLESNAHPNAIIKNGNGNTPLHVARGSQMVQLLISYGAWVEQKNDKGETPLLRLFNNMTTFCLDTAHALCTAGADVNTCDEEKNTPLHCAVKKLRLAEVKFLLHRGARCDVVNSQGETAYQVAEKRGGNVGTAFQEFIKVFRTINAIIPSNPPLSIVSLLVDSGEKLKKMLICDSCGYCSPDIVVVEKLFQQCDSDVWDELRSDISPYSAEALSLLKCIGDRCNHRRSFIQSLRNNNFMNACDLLMKNPYLLRTYEGEYERDEVNDLFVEKFIVTPVLDPQYCYLREMLYSGFFDVNVCDASGSPVLSVVIQQPDSGDKDLDILRVRGLNVNQQDKQGYQPLLFAAMLEKEDVVEKLLSRGAVVDKEGPFVVSGAMRKLIDDYKQRNA